MTQKQVEIYGKTVKYSSVSELVSITDRLRKEQVIRDTKLSQNPTRNSNDEIERSLEVEIILSRSKISFKKSHSQETGDLVIHQSNT